MLPDIRAVIAAIITATGLLTVSFGLVAAFRVAQDDRAGFLHAELALRGRPTLPVHNIPHAILIVDTSPMTIQPAPESEIAPPDAAGAAIETKAEAQPTTDTPVTVRSADSTQAVNAMLAAPVSEAAAIQEQEVAAPPDLPVGGPFVEVAQPSAQKIAQDRAAAEQRAAKAAAIRKARAARIARARRLAARRAAAARRATANQIANTSFGFGWNTPQTGSFDTFNSGFGGASAGNKPR